MIAETFRRSAGLAVALASCAPWPSAPGEPSIDDVSAELGAMGGAIAARRPDTWRSILADAIAKDAYVCLPSARDAFFGPGEGVRNIRGVMPHYGFFLGPMKYTVTRAGGASGATFRVVVRVALDPPPETAELELPDCVLRGELEGEVRCEGVPYSLSGTTDACPASGVFRARATRHNVEALARRWSREAERYYDRDAEAFGLPVRYDFDFFLADEDPASSDEADLHVPLSPTCGRTPYFSAMRSGWSLPIVAHEIGHVMGLLDEYEAFSGIVSAYPKTPFPGAEVSRMGLSMKEGTVLLPLHHYLVVRRWFCPEPRALDPFTDLLR